MKTLIKNKWQDGFMDYSVKPGFVRIAVSEWYNVQQIYDLYSIPNKNWRTIYNYLKEVGPIHVIRKILSRWSENARNEKFLSLGRGYIIDSDTKEFKNNQFVNFIAPCHPRCIERIVLPQELVHRVEKDLCLDEIKGKIIFGQLKLSILPNELYHLLGWSEYSGKCIPENLAEFFANEFTQLLKKGKSATNVDLTIKNPSEVCERRVVIERKLASKPNAVLFGYGQYAKTIILPNIKKSLRIDCIHEIDPVQIGRKAKHSCVDTSSSFRSDEHYDICFIAGYHHTHAPLAIEALKQDMTVVVEKPLVTTGEDLASMLATLAHSKGKYYSGFQKRYSPFNSYIYQDLDVKLGHPISYSCIVYEIPLGPLHWYKWPNSKSRVMSNACHWLDHFLFLNKFSIIRQQNLSIATNEEIQIFLELANGAVFSMLLTDKGSNRIGLQEYVELRANNGTVKITNASHYVSENKNGIIRKSKINKLSIYKLMYQQIVKNFLANTGSDSMESIYHSTAITMSLESILREKISTSSMAEI